MNNNIHNVIFYFDNKINTKQVIIEKEIVEVIKKTLTNNIDIYLIDDFNIEDNQISIIYPEFKAYTKDPLEEIIINKGKLIKISLNSGGNFIIEKSDTKEIILHKIKETLGEKINNKIEVNNKILVFSFKQIENKIEFTFGLF